MSTNQNPGCLAALLNLFSSKPKASDIVWQINTEEPPEELPYRMRDDFLSPAEHSFYLVLKGLLPPDLTLCAKVSLADLFFVAHPDQNKSAYNRINRKHVDFLACDAQTMQPCFAVELDDSSHRRPEREERDDFVNRVFATAGLPLLHVPAQRAYSAGELQALLQPLLSPAVKTPPAAASSAQPAEQAPFCPKCGARMVLRTARQGAQTGQTFYGCPNYPKCRTILPVKAE